jgi:hypothetical protein
MTGDFVRTRNLATGEETITPLKATPEQQRQAEIEALRRELVGVDFRLEQLDAPLPPTVLEVPSRGTVSRTRKAWENTRKAIVAKIELLEAEGDEAA